MATHAATAHATSTHAALRCGGDNRGMAHGVVVFHGVDPVVVGGAVADGGVAVIAHAAVVVAGQQRVGRGLARGVAVDAVVIHVGDGAPVEDDVAVVAVGHHVRHALRLTGDSHRVRQAVEGAVVDDVSVKAFDDLL